MNEKTFRIQIVRSSKDVLAFYDQYAPTWDARFGIRRSTAEFHRIRLKSFLKVAELKKTDRLVELGVGTGPYLDVLAPLVGEIICIDGSKQMLEVLWANHTKLTNIRLLQLDLEQSLADISFEADVLYSFGLLEHIIDVDAFIGNCKSMLKTEGRVVFISPNGHSPWYGVMRKLWRAGPHCSTDKYYEVEQITDLMKRHGFSFEKALYWGYFPAGVGDILYKTLDLLGKIIDRTWLRQYAGGITTTYVLS